MKLSVTVKPNARQERVEKIAENTYQVFANAPAKEGKANEAVIRLLAEYFKLPKSAVCIKQGLNGRKKLVEIR